MSRLHLPARIVLAAGALGCLVAPLLFWVGRGGCGWACYSPLSAPAEAPVRLDDAHIGWHVAPTLSVVLVLLALTALSAALAGRGPSRRRTRASLGGAAGAVAAWALIVEAGAGQGVHQGYGKGGFLAAASAVALMIGLLFLARRPAA